MALRNFWNEGRLYHLEGKQFDSFDDVMSACGLDFTAEKVPLYHIHKYIDDAGKEVNLQLDQPFAELVRREDDKTPLGVNSTIYGLTQYRQWFSLPEQLWQGGITLSYGGVQAKGARAYLVMRAEGTIKLADNDYIFNEFVVTASHDGTGKLTLMMTPRRTANETIVSFPKPLISFKHSKNVQSRIYNTGNIIGKIKDSWDEFSHTVQVMTQVKLSEQEARDFIKGVVGDNDSVRSENVRAKIYDLWSKFGVGRVIPACNGTLFGLVQAFYEYSDHHVTVRKSKYLDPASAALDTKALGNTAKQKAKGWSMALTLMRNKDQLTGLTKDL